MYLSIYYDCIYIILLSSFVVCFGCCLDWMASLQKTFGGIEEDDKESLRSFGSIPRHAG